MGKARWAVVVLVVFAAGVGAGWLARGHSWRPAPKGKYAVRAHCLNCDWEGTVYIAKGESVDKVACQRCEVWHPEGPSAEDRLSALGNWASELDVAIVQSNWERERRSTLVTQGRWEAGPSGQVAP